MKRNKNKIKTKNSLGFKFEATKILKIERNEENKLK